MPEDELAPDTQAVGFRERDCAFDLFERDPLLDLQEHLRIARLDAELERLEVGRLEEAHKLLVDTIHPRLGREANAAVEVARNDPFEDRLRAPHVQSERLVLDPNALRSVTVEDLFDFVEDVCGRSVARLEARVVPTEHTLERAAAVGDEWECCDRSEEIPRRERERVVVVRRRTRRSVHEIRSAPRDEPRNLRGIDAPLERVDQLAGEVLAFADACIVETVAFFESLPTDRVDMCAADEDRNVRAIDLDPARDLDRARVFDGHARDPHEVRSPVANTRNDVVDVQVGQLAVEQLDRVAGGTERARDVRDPEPRKARPVFVELTARRRLDERDPQRGFLEFGRGTSILLQGVAQTRKPRRPRQANWTLENPAVARSSSTPASV